VRRAQSSAGKAGSRFWVFYHGIEGRKRRGLWRGVGMTGRRVKNPLLDRFRGSTTCHEFFAQTLTFDTAISLGVNNLIFPVTKLSLAIMAPSGEAPSACVCRADHNNTNHVGQRPNRRLDRSVAHLVRVALMASGSHKKLKRMGADPA
jgi:hypothetical protein